MPGTTVAVVFGRIGFAVELGGGWLGDQIGIAVAVKGGRLGGGRLVLAVARRVTVAGRCPHRHPCSPSRGAALSSALALARETYSAAEFPETKPSVRFSRRV